MCERRMGSGATQENIASSKNERASAAIAARSALGASLETA